MVGRPDGQERVWGIEAASSRGETEDDKHK